MDKFRVSESEFFQIQIKDEVIFYEYHIANRPDSDVILFLNDILGHKISLQHKIEILDEENRPRCSNHCCRSGRDLVLNVNEDQQLIAVQSRKCIIHSDHKQKNRRLVKTYAHGTIVLGPKGRRADCTSDFNDRDRHCVGEQTVVGQIEIQCGDCDYITGAANKRKANYPGKAIRNL